jgi:hypothetical protein
MKKFSAGMGMSMAVGLCCGAFTLCDAGVAKATFSSNFVPGTACTGEFSTDRSDLAYSSTVVYNNSSSGTPTAFCPYFYTTSGSPFSNVWIANVTGTNPHPTQAMHCTIVRVNPSTGASLGSSEVTFPANTTAATTETFAVPPGSGGIYTTLCGLPPTVNGNPSVIISLYLETNT